MRTSIDNPEPATGDKLAINETLPRFADKRAVAAMLGLSVRSVDNYLGDGMPHLKLGARRVRFDLEEVRRWLKERFGTQRRNPAKVSS